ncbi:hypothetical protein EMIT036CA2_20587 [Chryseobacterium sp. IT-36CA2]
MTKLLNKKIKQNCYDIHHVSDLKVGIKKNSPQQKITEENYISEKSATENFSKGNKKTSRNFCSFLFL